MKARMITVVSLISGLVLSSHGAELSAGLKSLQGKWAGSRTNRDGERYSFTLDFKEDKVRFEAKDAGGDPRMVATGTVKTEKAGTLNVMTLSDLRAGRSADDLQDVSDTRTSIYVIREGQLLIASNFDRERENERPRVDEYTRASSSATTSTPTGASLAGTWNVDVALGEQNFDYKFRVEKEGDGFQTTMVSPRSGEHKTKSTTLKGIDVEILVDREIEGNNVTFVYKGKLAEKKISGTVTVKGLEDQVNGTWTATR